MRGKIWLGGPRTVVPGTGESAEVLLPAGLGSCTGLYVAVRGIGGEGASAHVHMADSVAGTNIIERCLCRSEGMWRCRQERAVKPSAQPTLVRTQHLPPPAETAPWLRKRARGAVLLLVTLCLMACHCGLMCRSVHGRIADGVRAGRAVGDTVGFPRTATDGPVKRGCVLPRGAVPARCAARWPASSGRGRCRGG